MKFAIAGNPNCGKTTLFNALTGASAHVGNWPGVTVDKKEGVYKKGGFRAEIIDLPGIYSLSPYSPEEVIASNYILNENPDLIINIVDATNLERNIYLTTQLLESDCPIVVALNMTDVARRDGIKIDVRRLEEELGVSVVEICALKKSGIEKLMDTAAKEAKKPRSGKSVLEESEISCCFEKICGFAKDARHAKFRAVKALEGDAKNSGLSQDALLGIEKIKNEISLPSEFDSDFEAAVANWRYSYISKKISPCIKRKSASEALTISDKIDRVLTGKVLGLPIFFALMFFVFHLTFSEDLFFLASLGILEEPLMSPGVYLLGLTEVFTEWLTGIVSSGLDAVKAAEWVKGMMCDGLLAGVGAVLSFMPQIMMLFVFLYILEDTGYMARAAFLMDRFLRRFGLSGKAFLPLLMCFGCLVPAIMGSRTLENDKERKLMIMLAPFFSCGAKLPIWSMFAMAIFPSNADIAIFSIYMIGIITAIIAAIILKKTVFKGDASVFIMELPPYHLPLIKNIALNVWEKLKIYIARAATIIAAATVVIWFLSSFSFGFSMVETNSNESILGVLGSFLQPLFIPLGFANGDIGWKAVVAILTGLIAKEMVVSTMGVLYNPNVEGDALEDDAASSALAATIVATFSPAAAVAFMAFNLLSVPCMAAVATANAEFKSAKWTWATIAFWIATAWVVSFVIYQIGSLLGY